MFCNIRALKVSEKAVKNAWERVYFWKNCGMQLPFGGFYSLQKLSFGTDLKTAILKKTTKVLNTGTVVHRLQACNSTETSESSSGGTFQVFTLNTL